VVGSSRDFEEHVHYEVGTVGLELSGHESEEGGKGKLHVGLQFCIPGCSATAVLKFMDYGVIVRG
jgi:hypothetical protein